MKKVTPVFTISVIIAVIFVLWGVIAPDNLAKVSTAVQNYIQNQFGWLYLISATVFLLFGLFLAFSKYGKIKLGKDDEEPEYSTFSWFAMLFSAGMGIGLVFYGVAEPISHYYQPPVGDGKTAEAARLSMQYTSFHWGLHPWGIYALIALALAYFKFRKEAPGTISATFYPLLGERGVNGWVGKLIDVIAVFATVFGVATSLGLGAVQIDGGLHYLNNNIPNGVGTQFIIIVVVTCLFMLSAVSGIGRGIKWLSNANVAVAIILMLFVLVVGPTGFIMKNFTSTLGNYLQNLPKMSFQEAPFNSSHNDWINAWTLFYWSWWIAWCPFVGTFIARVSRGRTIREFVMVVLIVPTVFSIFWFAVFGGAGLDLEMFKHAGIWHAMAEGSHVENALFAALGQFPFNLISSILAIILISTFFITSADSATFVLGMQTTNGMLNPPNVVKLTWGIIQAAAASVLLFSGGLNALQTASFAAALPFTIILIFMMFSLYKAFKNENPRLKKKRKDLV
jgi:glycine betaine transporter